MEDIIPNKDALEKDHKYVAHTYNRTSGIGTNSLEFCNNKWLEAVISQAKQLQYNSNLFCTLPDAFLAERLCEITGYLKAFFEDSGAEADEGAIKIAKKYGMEKKGKNCNRIIILENSLEPLHLLTQSLNTDTMQDINAG